MIGANAAQLGAWFAAAARAGPNEVRLVLEDPVPSGISAGALFLAISAAAGAILLVVGALVLWRRAIMDQPGERGFRVLSRWLGLSRKERRLVRALARLRAGATPVALLISRHALDEAIDAGAGDPAIDADAARRVGDKYEW